MRVLLVSQEMPPETDWGGIGTYVAALAPALASAGAEVHVLSVVPGQPASDHVIGGVAVHRRDLRRPPGVGRISRLPESWERVTLAAAVERVRRTLPFEPDVVEAPEWRAEGLGVALGRGVPLVIRLHSAAEQLFPYSGRAGLDRRLAVWLERRSIAAADLVVSTPSNLADYGARLNGSAGRMPAMQAVDLPVAGPSHPAARPVAAGPVAAGPVAAGPVAAGPVAPAAAVVAERAPSQQADAPRVVFVGRLERRKGPETLVAAARAVVDAVPSARFSFIGADTGLPGGGSYSDMLRAQARRLGIEHALELDGHRPHPEVIADLRRAAVCAFPARHETFGYGAAEAAAAGRPVVASRIPPFVSLLGGAAVLVDAGDVPGWAEAIIGLLRDPQRAERLGAAAALRVRDRCSPERIAAEMLEVYAEAQARARRRAYRPRPWERRVHADAPVS
jgi:glycogen(starch) synthase